MLTIEDIRALGEVNPEFAPILDSNSPFLGSWNLDTDIHELRTLIAASKAGQPRPDVTSLPYLQEDIEIPVRDNRSVAARVYKPREAAGNGCPGFIVFHGGGYTVGDLDTETWLCALFTKLGGVAVNVDYRHAPEHIFPSAIEDAFDATKWIAQNAKSLEIDPAKGLIIGGESSGADMSLIVAHLCHNERMAPPLTGIYASIPGAVNPETLPEKYRDRFFSMEQNANAPVLSAESVAFVRKNYMMDLTSPLAFPLAFPTHSRLPKTYFQVCGLDAVRDCGLVLEQAFSDDRVQTRLDIYPGVPHAFWALFPELELSGKQGEDARRGLEWLLKK